MGVCSLGYGSGIGHGPFCFNLVLLVLLNVEKKQNAAMRMVRDTNVLLRNEVDAQSWR